MFSPDALVVYHSKDLDGITSGYLLRELLVRKSIPPICVGYDYADKIPDDITNYGGPIIYMADVTLPIDVMIELSKKHVLILLDHHETFYLKYLERKDEFHNTFKYFYDKGKSGSLLCYEFAIKHIPSMDTMFMAQIVKLVDDYDLFKSAYTNTNEWENNVLPFQYGLRAKSGTNLNKYPNFLSMNFDSIQLVYNHILNAGKEIINYLEGDNEILAKAYSFVKTPKQGVFKGLKILCLNKSNGSLLTVKNVYDEKQHDLALFFAFNGEKYNCSVRTTSNDIHLGLLAQELGGGGHAKASGFSVKNLDEIFK